MHKHVLKNGTKTLKSASVIISVTGHMALDGICSYFPLLPILYCFYSQ